MVLPEKVLSRAYARYGSPLIFFKFPWFGDSILNKFRSAFLQRESKHTEGLIGRHHIGNLYERTRTRGTKTARTKRSRERKIEIESERRLKI